MRTVLCGSVAPVHDRLPLIAENDAVSTWIFDDSKAEQMLTTSPVLSKKSTENGCMDNAGLL